MLNISPNRVPESIIQREYMALQQVIDPKPARRMAYWLMGIMALGIIILFLPWTQNINARGEVTLLRPSDRPQELESTLDGRVEEWYVVEGDTVNAGDTLLYITEIKDKYFDPNLTDRLQDQVSAKKQTNQAYAQKAQALANQIDALRKTMLLKIEQADNKIQESRFKVQADSIDLVAAQVSDSIAFLQLKRWEGLFEQELKSRTDLEKMRKQRQEAQAKLLAQQAKVSQARISLVNAHITRNNIGNEYAEKLAKAASDRQSALSSQFSSEGDIAKLQNEQVNVAMRAGYRYIVAPQHGVVQKTLKAGQGETVKAGEGVLTLVPLNGRRAVEIYIRPMDIPWVGLGERVRLEFDGWPTLIFGDGWPAASFGTFGAQVFAIENNIEKSGMYRLLLIESDTENESWPEALRIGAGVNAFALLGTVPVWYEIWRQLNGFPPEFYERDTLPKDLKKGGK